MSIGFQPVLGYQRPFSGENHPKSPYLRTIQIERAGQSFMHFSAFRTAALQYVRRHLMNCWPLGWESLS
jgi:hypothetical protein